MLGYKHIKQEIEKNEIKICKLKKKKLFILGLVNS
jgi:hypothetical protein